MKIDLTEPIECAEPNVFLNEKEAYNQIFRAQLQRYAPEISFPYASMPNEFKEMMKKFCELDREREQIYTRLSNFCIIHSRQLVEARESTT